MSKLSRAYRNQEGAVFVQIGIAVFVLMAFNVFVLDYGMMWVARGQAQNAADAGALAGAVARSYDDLEDPPDDEDLVAGIAQAVAQANLIWQAPGTATASFNCPAGVTGRCTQVNVSRTFPTLFGPILGVHDQSVRATATAISRSGNATPCLRPIAVADEWIEENSNNRFNRFSEVAPPAVGTVIANPDSYDAPSATYHGSTTIPHDVGTRIIWELDRNLDDPITRGLVLPLAIPGAGTFHDAMVACSGQPVSLGQTLQIQLQPPGQTQTALDDIMDQDPGVTWDDAEARVGNTCAPGCAPISPRIVPIALYDPERFQRGRATDDWTQAAVGCPTNDPCITVRNIVGFFVHGAFGGYGPHGHFLRYPGTTVSTAPTYPDEGSWVVTQMLIR